MTSLGDYASAREIRDELRASRRHRLALVVAVTLLISSAAIMLGLLAWMLLAVTGVVSPPGVPAAIMVNTGGVAVAILCLFTGLELMTWNLGCALSRSEVRDLRALLAHLEHA